MYKHSKNPAQRGPRKVKRSVRNLVVGGACTALALAVPSVGAVPTAFASSTNASRAVVGAASLANLVKGSVLVVWQKGAVVDGRNLHGSILVLADNVQIKHTTVTSTNWYAIAVLPGVTGTVITDSTINCGRASTVAIGPGAHRTQHTTTHGCAADTSGSTTGQASAGGGGGSSTGGGASATPAPTKSATPSPTPSKPSPTQSAGPSPSPTSSSPTPTPSPTPVATTPVASPTPVASTPVASPSPTKSPDPTPTVPQPGTSGFSYVPLAANMKPNAALMPAAWPNATNTGVPSGVKLSQSGGVVVTKAGTVLSGLNINGCVDIKANNVVIENSKITCAGNRLAVRVYSGFSGLTIRDSEIDGGGKAVACIGYGGFTLLRDNLHNCVDGINGGNNTAVEYTYVHDLARQSGSHNDAFQTSGGSHLLIVGSNFQAYNAAGDDPMNAAIQTGHLFSNFSDALVEYNLFNGGNYTVNAGSTSTNGYTISGYVITGNRFGHDYRYGPVQGLGSGIAFDKSNIWTDTKLSVH